MFIYLKRNEVKVIKYILLYYFFYIQQQIYNKNLINIIYAIKNKIP